MTIEKMVCLVIGFLLLAALAAVFSWLRRFWLTTGIFEWHPHKGQMRREKRDGGFEWRPATDAEFMDHVDRGSW